MSVPDLSLFQQISATALEKLLDKVAGAKTLVLSPTLTGALGLITDVNLMRKHGVTKMFWLENGPLSPAAERQVVYVCRPEVQSMKTIAEQIRASSEESHTFTLIVSPQMSSVCTSTLSQEGVLGSIDQVYNFPIGFIPLEKDVLSLELDDAWVKLGRDADYTPAYDLAKALVTLQEALGSISSMHAKGDHAVYLCKTLHKLRNELGILDTTQTTITSGTTPFHVDSMLVLDRSVDLVTPLCTQLTFEGLVDEVYGIKGAHVEVDLSGTPTNSSEPSTSATAGSKKTRHHLSSTVDRVFPELRDTNFAVVGTVLNRIARRLNDDYQKRHAAQTPAELRQFVGQLTDLQAEHQYLKVYTTLAERLLSYTSTVEFNTALEVQQNLLAGIDVAGQEEAIRNFINKEAPLFLVLRMLCIYSIVIGGLKARVFEEFKKDVLETYGYEYVTLLIYLERIGLLTRWTGTKSSFAASRKALKLIVDDVDEENPNDMSYVFSGYAPLSIRLVQYAISKGIGKKSTVPNGSIGWKGMEDTLRSLPGQVYEWERPETGPERQSIPITLVVFVGGVTYAEISALRLLGKQDPNRNFVVLTTNIINGNSLLEGLADVKHAKGVKTF